MEKHDSREIRRSGMLMESMCSYCRFGKQCPESTEKEANNGLLPVMKCPGFTRRENG